MKRLIMLLIVILLSMNVYAATINFTWDRNTEEDLAGYRLYQSNVSSKYDPNHPIKVIGKQFNTCTIENVLDGKWFWVLTAYNIWGYESGYSNEVTATVHNNPPMMPKGLKLNPVVQINIINAN